jgi:uncharacterized membrane protein required for colicin V production
LRSSSIRRSSSWLGIADQLLGARFGALKGFVIIEAAAHLDE